MILPVPYKVVKAQLLDVRGFVAALDMEDFYHDLIRSCMGNFQHTLSIIFRHSLSFIAQTDGNLSKVDLNNSFVDFPLMPKYKEHVEYVLSELRKHYQFKDYAMLLALLQPGKDVGLHTDSGNILETCHRVHIPLITNPKCLYTIDDVTWHMKKGVIYEIDNMRPHTVLNGGVEVRVHLIANLYP